jgi:hypothetical protein
VAIENALASVAVKDLDSAVKWYERILYRPPSRPMAEVAEWSFEGGGSLQVYQLPKRAGSGSFTLIVTDIAEQIAQGSPSPSISAWPMDGICKNIFPGPRGVIKALAISECILCNLLPRTKSALLFSLKGEKVNRGNQSSKWRTD